MLWAVVQSSDDSTRQVAIREWRQLHRLEHSQIRWQSFVALLTDLPSTQECLKAAERLPVGTRADPRPAAYAGSASCADGGCHRPPYSSWRDTGKARILVPY